MTVVIIISVVIIAILVAMVVVKWKEAKMFASQVDVVKSESEQRLNEERQRSTEELKRLQEDHKQQIGMLRAELENATRNILEKQSEKLKTNNSEQIGIILDPLREQLRNMKETIDQNKESHTRDASALREAGVAVEIYPENTKLKKQFDYADHKAIPFISINGSDEAAAGQVNIKNLATGEQKSFCKDDVNSIIAFLG